MHTFDISFVRLDIIPHVFLHVQCLLSWDHPPDDNRSPLLYLVQKPVIPPCVVQLAEFHRGHNAAPFLLDDLDLLVELREQVVP